MLNRIQEIHRQRTRWVSIVIRGDLSRVVFGFFYSLVRHKPMMFHELIEIFDEYEGDIESFEVVLATRKVNGKILESGASIRNIAELTIDEIGPEVVMYPPSFVDDEEQKKVIYSVRDFRNFQIPSNSKFELMAVDNKKELPNNRVAIATNPIIGALWYEEENQLWLLQSPKTQWPEEWFA